MVGKRLQLQERIGSDIADVICKVTGSEDVHIHRGLSQLYDSKREIKRPNTKHIHRH